MNIYSNIIRNSESSYQIVIALAGFSSKDITVSLSENILTVKGNIESDDNADKYLDNKYSSDISSNK